MSLVSKIYDSDIFIGNEDPIFEYQFEQDYMPKIEEITKPEPNIFNPQQKVIIKKIS